MGEHIRPAKAEHRIDFSRPGANARHGGQAGDDLGIGQVAEGVKVDTGFGQGTGIAQLRARQATGAQVVIAGRADGGG